MEKSYEAKSVGDDGRRRPMPGTVPCKVQTINNNNLITKIYPNISAVRQTKKYVPLENQF